MPAAFANLVQISCQHPAVSEHRDRPADGQQLEQNHGQTSTYPLENIIPPAYVGDGRMKISISLKKH